MIREIKNIPQKEHWSSTKGVSQNRKLLDADIADAFAKGIYQFEVVDDRYDYNKMTTNQVEGAIRGYLFNLYYDDMVDEFNDRLREYLPYLSYGEKSFSHAEFDYVCKGLYVVQKIYDSNEGRYRLFITLVDEIFGKMWNNFEKRIEENLESAIRQQERKLNRATKNVVKTVMGDEL